MDAVRALEPFPDGPFAVDSGQARFVHFGDTMTLYINGLPSSQWSLDHPEDLEFEYMRWMLAATEAVFAPDAALRALHLGAAACALPRAIVHAFPASRHLAVESDRALAAAVRRHVALPRSPVLRIRVDDAVHVLAARPAGSHDLIVRDAFDPDGLVPPGLADGEAALAAARALRPDGLYLANCGDLVGMPRSRAEHKALTRAFAYVALITEPAQLRGRRLGNVVLLARHQALTPPQEADLERRLRAGGFPARLLGAAEARRWSGHP
ncbi:MAG: fused MFS/spermidine synthase [Bifidobacteriaceae bacterium]|nr:fused MFS/spermidine synthase [Bifidobacteriaceae bacterium]